MKLSIFRALGTLLLMLSVFSVSAEELTVTDPWVRTAPPNAPALAAFMTLENRSGSDISVVDVRTSLAVVRVELHRTIMTDGMMKMHPQKLIPVPPHSSTELKPGSWHIMLIGPKKVPTEGEVVHLILVLSDGSEQIVTASVRQGKMMMEGHSNKQKVD
jgi:hypothetical protein